MVDQNVDVAQLFQGIVFHLNNLTGTIKSEDAHLSGEAKGYKEWTQKVETQTEPYSDRSKVKKLLKTIVENKKKI